MINKVKNLLIPYSDDFGEVLSIRKDEYSDSDIFLSKEKSNILNKGGFIYMKIKSKSNENLIYEYKEDIGGHYVNDMHRRYTFTITYVDKNNEHLGNKPDTFKNFFNRDRNNTNFNQSNNKSQDNNEDNDLKVIKRIKYI